MAYPDFIGIGAQKAGTTWLSHNLQLHPEIWMPGIKELHYFNERISDPSNPVLRLPRKLFGNRVVERRWRRQVKARSRRHLKKFHKERLLWDLKYYLGAPDDEWYASLFEPGGGKVAGEITPAYSLLGSDDVAHVHDLVPQAKIIFLMRNPIERAWSQAVMQFDKSGKQPRGSSRERKLQRNFESEGSRVRTDYLRTLEAWRSHYPEEQIFVGFLEDISFFPGELLGQVYEFLGVDSSFKPPGIGRKVHTRSAGRAPTQAMVYLARLYREEISRLDEYFGGYASFWLYCAERLLEDPPEEEEMSYPLWGSAFWEEWLNSTGAKDQRLQLRSRPLPLVWKAR